MKASFLISLLAISLAQTGCAASIAASALGAAVNATRPSEPRGDPRPMAVAACSAQAAAHGEVHIIDSEQGRGGLVTVWGTVSSAQRRQAFECRYRGKVGRFNLRDLPPAGAKALQPPATPALVARSSNGP